MFWSGAARIVPQKPSSALGNGGSDDDAQKPGETTAWVSGADGQRVSFDVTVATTP